MSYKTIFPFIFAFLLISHKAKAQDYQLSYANTDVYNIDSLFNQSVFSLGISTFLKDIFALPTYGQDFLPNNFFHLIEFLYHGQKTGKDALFVRSVLRLYHNKIKATPYINVYAFCDLLGQLPSLLEPYFVIDSTKALGSLKEVIYEIQYRSFMTQFDEFKTSPDTFLKNLSAQIEDAAELRKLVMLFLDTTLSKLIWSPADQFDTWQSTKLIADQLHALYKRNIISDLDDLNSLCITLLERYCFFLDIASSHFDIQTFEKIKEDINNCRTPLLDLEEQESLIETKLQRFTRCLMEVEAKARAREAGIVV